MWGNLWIFGGQILVATYMAGLSLVPSPNPIEVLLRHTMGSLINYQVSHWQAETKNVVSERAVPIRLITVNLTVRWDFAR